MPRLPMDDHALLSSMTMSDDSSYPVHVEDPRAFTFGGTFGGCSKIVSKRGIEKPLSQNSIADVQTTFHTFLGVAFLTPPPATPMDSCWALGSDV